MPRPTLLIAEPEPSQALSVRKLVLESGSSMFLRRTLLMRRSICFVSSPTSQLPCW